MNYSRNNNWDKHSAASGNGTHRSRRGFSLVEVSLAVGVAGFCLLSLFGLLPLGLSSNQTSLEQTMAGNIAGAIVADLRCAQPLVTGSSPRFGFNIPGAQSPSPTIASTPQTLYLTANGTAIGVVGNNPVISGTAIPVYRATVGFAPPSSGQRTATAVRLIVTWPALADSNPSLWPSNYTGSCEVDTTLDRN
jgi:uncharacterized protein (TIGR02598 family)